MIGPTLQLSFSQFIGSRSLAEVRACRTYHSTVTYHGLPRLRLGTGCLAHYECRSTPAPPRDAAERPRRQSRAGALAHAVMMDGSIQSQGAALHEPLLPEPDAAGTPTGARVPAVHGAAGGEGEGAGEGGEHESTTCRKSCCWCCSTRRKDEEEMDTGPSKEEVNTNWLEPREILTKPMAADLNVRTINVRIETLSEWELSACMVVLWLGCWLPYAIVQRTIVGGDDDIVAPGANPCDGAYNTDEHGHHLESSCFTQATARFIISCVLVLLLVSWAVVVWRHWRWRPLWLEHSIVVLFVVGQIMLEDPYRYTRYTQHSPYTPYTPYTRYTQHSPYSQYSQYTQYTQHIQRSPPPPPPPPPP